MRERIGFGAAVFLGAVLLFAVEPMAARELLPRMGGSSAVWLAALCFFQVVLLLGYGYAYLLTSRGNARWVVWVHVGLLAVALVQAGAARPLGMGAGWEEGHPFLAVFRALARRVGLPFALLAAGSPLLQVVVARRWGRVPWRMFALSNVGSLVGLLGYPLVVEPWLDLRAQRWWWMAGFAVYAGLSGGLVWRGLAMGEAGPYGVTGEGGAAEGAAPDAATEGDLERGGGRRGWLCFALGAVASMQLVAVTGHLTENVAALPLLWVLPLAMYLVGFALAFEAPGMYRRGLVVRLLVVMLASLGYLLSKTDVSLPIGLAVAFFLLELFLACWFCAAEVYLLRPSGARAAAWFYLELAAGGAAGTALVVIGFPAVFRANYDLPLAFAATAAVALWAMWAEGWAVRALWAVSTAGCLLLTGALVNGYRKDALVLERNFYGSLRVKQTLLPAQAGTSRVLLHGQIQHGMQWFAPEFRGEPLSYYARDSGVGLAMAATGDGPRRVGVIGLGAGTMAAYGRAGDTVRFYEINPAVERLARELFIYLRESRARVEVVTGDARLRLAAEPAAGEYDVLVVDAFSGDAIPVHLLTREALAMYRRHLRPGGLVAFHVSNQYLDLAPVVGAVARAEGMEARVVESGKMEARGEFEATWVLVAAPGGRLEQGGPLWEASSAVTTRTGVRAWTDGYSSLLPVVRWTGR